MKYSFLILTLLLVGACGGDSPQPGQGPGGGPGGGGRPRGAGGSADEVAAVSVKAYRVDRKPISTYILSNTTLESIRKVTIFAKINALVKEILVEEGSVVSANQLLARLDDREINNEFAQARIALEQAQLSLQQSEVKAELSKSTFDRSQSLFEQKLISQQEYDQSALVNRTDNLSLEVAAQQLQATQARLEAAQIQLDYTQIRSSIGGVITQRLIEVGSRVAANQAVFNVEDSTPLWARIFVPEKELPQIRLRQTADLRVQAFPTEKFRGVVKMISPTVDPESGTVKVTLEVREGQKLLRPGMFGTVSIATETHPNALVVPKRAVLRERDENRVFVIASDGTVEKRAVSLGFTQENEVEVLSGLSEGEAVVTVGQEGLNSGYPVTVLAWERGEAAPMEVVPSRPAPPVEARIADPAGAVPSPHGAADRPHEGGGERRGMGQQFDPQQAQAFLQRMLENPEVKQAYEKQLKEDPGFAGDPEKLRAFMREMRSKMPRRERP